MLRVDPTSKKVLVPKRLQQRLVRSYHDLLLHPGAATMAHTKSSRCKNTGRSPSTKAVTWRRCTSVVCGLARASVEETVSSRSDVLLSETSSTAACLTFTRLQV
ncbi:hypothetical protein PR002_g30202 [Phytophthora rubi]|uniref:Uncharacterized protein n=1 Tax=Phytophthora rubi TaxID=129364 RepID=A0A6A3GU71_9STRA|nr:hypothetical protein PR002_g30202 [Phytophthora rubi]